MRLSVLLLATVALAGCRVSDAGNQAAGSEAGNTAGEAAKPVVELSLTRLDCGHADFKDMNGFFSDRPGVYPPGPGKVTDSCYLIRHGDQQMIWDTGLPAATIKTPITVAATDCNLHWQIGRIRNNRCGTASQCVL